MLLDAVPLKDGAIEAVAETGVLRVAVLLQLRLWITSCEEVAESVAVGVSEEVSEPLSEDDALPVPVPVALRLPEPVALGVVLCDDVEEDDGELGSGALGDAVLRPDVDALEVPDSLDETDAD